MPTSTTPPKPDFQALFESAPGRYFVLTSDLKIVAVSDAYLRASRIRREEIVGRGLFEVFPDDPHAPHAAGVNELRASLKRVIRGKVSDAMAVQIFNVQRPQSDGGGFEETFWSPTNSPVLDAGGRILYIIHRVENVTEAFRLKRQCVEQGRPTEELRTHAHGVELELLRAMQQLQEMSRQLREVNAALASRDGGVATDDVRSHDLTLPLRSEL